MPRRPRSPAQQAARRATTATLGAISTIAGLWAALNALAPGSAAAYPWMIRHGYTGCSACHFDPSGAGILTEYGRAMTHELLATDYCGNAEGDGAGFLWGALDLPEWLLLGADVREIVYVNRVEDAPFQEDWFLMRADGFGLVQVGGVFLFGSLGYAERGALGAAVTRGTEHNVVSREVWGGYMAGEVMVRAGRMNLPFGLRNVEHTLWVRSQTRTDINDDQQYGVAVSYSDGRRLRSEVLAIAGNFQLRPDDYRERGYSAYFELSPVEGLAVGVSSLLTHRELDPRLRVPAYRQVHGVFARFTPWQPLALMTEWDYAFESPRYLPRREGPLGVLQADLEALSGLHLIATGELTAVGTEDAGTSLGAWASVAWFFLPQLDVRLDAMVHSLESSGTRTRVDTAALQVHLFL